MHMNNQYDQNFVIKEIKSENVEWRNALDSSFQLYGFYWIKEDKKYRRLSTKSIDILDKICPKINWLAGNTAGGQIHFWTDSSKLSIRVKLTGPVDLSVMTRTAQGGFDCYIGDNFKDLKFIDSARIQNLQTEYEYVFFENLPGKKLVVLNFPLYTGVESCFIGLDENAMIKKAKSFNDKNRIVMYGTSITQGGCASRPGLQYTNFLSRVMKREILNFGFSGNAFGEKEVANEIAKVKDVSLFVIDYEANAGTNGKLALTLDTFIDTIRSYHPTVPIAVVSRIPYILDSLKSDLGKNRLKIKEFQIETVKKYQSKGDSAVHFIDGSVLLGPVTHECTVDSVHPNDLGFYFMTTNFAKAFKKILKK